MDAGCASGYLADQLRKNNWRVIGIEPDARAAAVARGRCDALVESPLEDVDFRGLGPYQAVVFGDVLEHLVHPDSVLQSAVRSLDSGGAVLASLPNTAFVLIRMSLLFGRFDYTERGILDETHLRFFTKRSALSLLVSSGIAVESAKATIPPIELVMSGIASPAVRPTRALLRALARIWPAGFGYQFVFSGTKAG